MVSVKFKRFQILLFYFFIFLSEALLNNFITLLRTIINGDLEDDLQIVVNIFSP